jgi:hypothetical protein
MFSVEWKASVSDVSGRTGIVYRTEKNGPKLRVCNVTSWAMGSCAVATLQSWGWICRIYESEVDQFFKWLCDEVDNDWQPNEFYFLLSDTQIKRDFKRLINHPNVKLRDRFKNKSHGPNRVSLYRYSTDKDFPRVVNKKVKS